MALKPHAEPRKVRSRTGGKGPEVEEILSVIPEERQVLVETDV